MQKEASGGNIVMWPAHCLIHDVAADTQMGKQKLTLHYFLPPSTIFLHTSTCERAEY